MGKYERKREKNPVSKAHIPPDIRKLIEGRMVSVPEPNRFFAKLWGAMLPATQLWVKEIKPNCVRLEPSFFESFMKRLVLRSGEDQLSNLRPTDILAITLCEIARELILDAIRTEHTLLWPEDRPTPEAWRRHAVLNPDLGLGNEIVFEYESGVGLKPVQDNLFRYPRIGLQVLLIPSSPEEVFPELVISIRGEALMMLIRPMLNFDDFHTVEGDQKTSKLIWDSLAKQIAVMLQINRPTRGAPGKQLGVRAALAHNQFGYSWTKVARSLCKKHHRHDSHCKENYRKQAEQFWKNERKGYAALAQAAREPSSSNKGSKKSHTTQPPHPKPLAEE
jgi:hypothetical protein